MLRASFKHWGLQYAGGKGLIKVYIIMNEMEKGEKVNLCSISHNTKMHRVPDEVNGQQVPDDKRKYLLTQWVIKLWKSLLMNVVMSASIDGFLKCFCLFLNRSI